MDTWFPHLGCKDREKWIKFVQNNRSEETWLPSNHAYVCSLHFRDEDKYTTKAGRRFLKKTAVPCIDPRSRSTTGIIEPISESVESPKEIVLKRKINDLINSKRKLTEKIIKVQRQNRMLKKKCESLTLVVKSLKTKFSPDILNT